MAVLLPVAGAVVFLTAADVGLPDIMADGRGEREAAADVELDSVLVTAERDDAAKLPGISVFEKRDLLPPFKK